MVQIRPTITPIGVNTHKTKTDGRLARPYEHYDLGYSKIDLVTVFDTILTSRQTCEKLQYLYENLMLNNFRKTVVLKKISIVN